MKVYYFSDNGRKFETEEECKKYDEAIRIQNAKKEERGKRRKRRLENRDEQARRF